MAGAPVCITSVHLDRSSKSLLKGKPSTIIGWELSKELPAGDKDVDLKRVPKCVYVQYYELDDMAARVHCKWKIGDLSPGVYPVTPITRTNKDVVARDRQQGLKVPTNTYPDVRPNCIFNARQNVE